MKELAFAAFDLDGTLLDPSEGVQVAVVEALLAMPAMGITPILITGRSSISLRAAGLPTDLLDAFGSQVLLQNGNVVRTGSGSGMRVQFPVPLGAIQALHGASIGTVLDFDFAIEASDRLTAARYALARGYPRSSIRVSPTPSANASRVLAYQDRERIAVLLRGRNDVVVVPTIEDDQCYVISSKLCKSTALTRYLHTEYSEDGLDRVIAFGDESNDVCMLATSRVGVAMAAAHPDAAAAATLHLTTSLGDYLTNEFPHVTILSRNSANCMHA